MHRVTAVLPLWSTQIKREKEDELIFRGLQYAEGIRIFQQRFGRLPLRLQELIEVEPRCIRQLWKDPITDSLDWGLVIGAGVPVTMPPAVRETATRRATRATPRATSASPRHGPLQRRLRADPRRLLRSTDTALRTFIGRSAVQPVAVHGRPGGDAGPAARRPAAGWPGRCRGPGGNAAPALATTFRA